MSHSESGLRWLLKSGLAWILLLVLPGVQSLAQTFSLSGTIVEAGTGNPVPNVSLYVNGTTLGTTSGSTGYFELSGITLPGVFIVSHVSYELKTIPLEDTAHLTGMTIRLDPRIVELREATIIHDQMRSNYLNRFKTWFLGLDYRDRNAQILNDSVLKFIVLENDRIEAFANEPLQILLPQTGYLIRSDLVHFTLSYEEALSGYHCSILGYFYFEELKAGTRRQQRTIARNRADSYYNTRMHFCRSLYQDKLAENGYQFTRSCFAPEEQEEQVFRMGDYKREYVVNESGTRMLYITDIACPVFQIKYYFRGTNKPVDLNTFYAHPGNMIYSGLRFLSDTVRIHPSGRIPENSILFSATIGSKGVAWMLPDDYIPSMQ